MKIYGLCVVKDEDDVIRYSITHALTFCDHVIVLDNGSTDETWSILQTLSKEYPSQITLFERVIEPFRNSIRSLVYNEFHHRLSEEDWWLRLDADEFIAQNPRPLIQQANREKADFIKAWQIQFYYTDKDHEQWLAGQEHRDLPITERRLYYKINWREYRFFRNQPSTLWDINKDPEWPDGLKSSYRKLIFNRHYQYRDPEQIQKRLEARHLNPDFKHVISLDWQTQIRPAQTLHLHTDDKPWKIDFVDFYRNKLLMSLKGKTPIY